MLFIFDSVFTEFTSPKCDCICFQVFVFLFFKTHELSPVYFFLSFFLCWFTFHEMSFCSCEIIFWPRRARWYQGKEELLEQISLTKEIKDKQKDHTTGKGKNYWKTKKDTKNCLKLYESIIVKELLLYF